MTERFHEVPTTLSADAKALCASWFALNEADHVVTFHAERTLMTQDVFNALQELIEAGLVIPEKNDNAGGNVRRYRGTPETREIGQSFFQPRHDRARVASTKPANNLAA